MSGRFSHRRGLTAIELMVALAILASVTAIVAVALPATGAPAAPSVPEPEVGDARRRAVETGRPVTISLARAGRVLVATAYPDGSVVADSGIGVERLTGRSFDAR